VFEQLERDFVESPDLVAEPGYVEIVDYFYTFQRGRNVRTRVQYDSERMQMQTDHIEKYSIQSFLASASNDPGDTCRVEVSSETPVDSPPKSTLINYVRVKQRRSFVDRRDYGDVWRYELSRTWSATTRDAVEYNQHNCEPSYEVECELVDTGGKYMMERDDNNISESLYMKILMLLGYDGEDDTSLEIHNVKKCASGVGGVKRTRH
tara:strand:+ start:5482 stop:6102 length:621 start_codon:yes stop_codon:yes gene_type:complete